MWWNRCEGVVQELCALWGFEEAVWLLWDCLLSSGGLPQDDVVLNMLLFWILNDEVDCTSVIL